MDDHVDVGDAVGELGVADVDDPPGDPGHVAPMVVQRDDLLDVRRAGQPCDQGAPDAIRRPRDGDDRAGATPWANLSCTQVERALLSHAPRLRPDNVKVVTYSSCPR
jgi:hypothetical protein